MNSRLVGGYNIRDYIAGRVSHAAWFAFTDTRKRAIDSLGLGRAQEIAFRNVSRITIWNRIQK